VEVGRIVGMAVGRKGGMEVRRKRGMEVGRKADRGTGRKEGRREDNECCNVDLVFLLNMTPSRGL
jgi:hypothetical protein